MNNEGFFRGALSKGLIEGANYASCVEWEGGFDVIIYNRNNDYDYTKKVNNVTKTNERRYASGHDEEHAWLAARMRITKEMSMSVEKVNKWNQLCASEILEE